MVLGGVWGRLLRREYLLSLLPALGDYHLLGLLVEILADLCLRGGVCCRGLLGQVVVGLPRIGCELLVVEQVQCHILACDFAWASIATDLGPSLRAAGSEVISLDETVRNSHSRLICDSVEIHD